jgi:hypothetical protein
MSLVFPIPGTDSPSESDAQPGLSLDTSAYQRSKWQVVGAAVQGISHKRHGLPCQDAQSYRLLDSWDGQILLIALADGAGSAERAEMGALFAVEAALQTIESILLESPEACQDLEYLVREAFINARKLLVDLAEEEGISLRQLATTLTCAIIAEGHLAAAQLGDGSIVVKDSKGELIAVSQPQKGEYANETIFLTQDDSLELLEVELLDAPVQSLAVMSDGLVRLAMQMPANIPHAPFFKPLFDFAGSFEDLAEAEEQLTAFLQSERVCTRTDDDKSIVLAVCKPTSTLQDRVEVSGK